MATEEATTTETKTPDAPKQAPNPSEIKGTLLAPEEVSDWGRNIQIVEKKAVTEAGYAEEESPAKEKAKTEEPKVESKVEPVAVVEEESQATLEDPGQFQPKDYSFEVQVFDAEGKNGKSRKVNSIEQWEQLLDSDPNFGNATSLLKAQRLATKMESGLERDKAEYDTKKEAY